ncbi:DNA polymerase III subunit delta' [Paraglaciecola aquimarina]|uniref:DNA-directed DNA polymerase n=1 Tax=Paraglaciecola aquimarina TaxID=1235557 RepID=A0ABU3SZ68_9ALTE|nr:DNA polymerase III subunit delta' [Paraglaciecola aquimarina]MDU0355305.1 DNA polymerase III subunit delta' [Paraglaciecola aquimarina]
MLPWFDQIFLQLSARIEQRKLHHAMLFQGPAGLGKSQFVMGLAQRLLCSEPQTNMACGVCQSCRLNASGTHPDLHQVESDKQIGVDAIRESIKKLVGSAHMSGAKVLIIHHADTMTESSANALLKTLEEPTDSTFLLLTTSRPERILPTIKSRCEKHTLPMPDLATCIKWVENQYKGEIDPNFARLFSARPLALLEELQQEQKFTFAVFKQGLMDLKTGSKNAAQLGTEWQEFADKVIKWSQYWLREQATLSSNKASVDLLFRINKQASIVANQMSNPGINRALQLVTLLNGIAQVNKVNSF